MNFSPIWVVFKIFLGISLIFPASVQGATRLLQEHRHIAGDFTTDTTAGVYPTWGNVCPFDAPNACIEDCVFAAVADWEMIALHYEPQDAVVERDFFRAGGGDEGIDIFRAYRWLRHYGLEGVHLRFKSVWEPSMRRLKRWVRHYGLLLASYGQHEVLIDGTGPLGIRYVTYGEQRELPWREVPETIEELTKVSVYAR